MRSVLLTFLFLFALEPTCLALGKRVTAVTLTTTVWTDNTRPTAANGSAPALASRSFHTDIIYPTAAAGSPRLPLIVFVHGLDTNRRQYSYLTRFLARAGYVVLAADYPLTASSTRGGSSDAHSDEQARDIAFLVDRLNDPVNAAAPWASLVDSSRYVVIGHSTGGTVALVAGFSPDYHDPRVAGVIALAPNACFFSPATFSTRTLPLAIIGASNDRYAPYANNAAWAYQSSLAPHALATLAGGNHVYMTDYCFPDWLTIPFVPVNDTALLATMAPYGPGTDCRAPARHELPAISCGDEHTLIRKVVRAFTDEMLRGDSRGVEAILGTHGSLSVTASRPR